MNCEACNRKLELTTRGRYFCLYATCTEYRKIKELPVETKNVSFLKYAGNFVLTLPNHSQLTQKETAEVFNILENKTAKECAEGVLAETVRQRRKRLYAKLGMPGADEIRQQFIFFLVSKLPEV